MLWIKAIGIALIEPVIALLALFIVVGGFAFVCWMGVYHPVLMIVLCGIALAGWALVAFAISVIATKRELDYERTIESR